MNIRRFDIWSLATLNEWFCDFVLTQTPNSVLDIGLPVLKDSSKPYKGMSLYNLSKIKFHEKYLEFVYIVVLLSGQMIDGLC